MLKGTEFGYMQARVSIGDGFHVSVASTPSTSSLGGSEQDDVESQGDVYIWGEVLADEVSSNGIGSKTDVLIPKLLESNFVLDIHHISSGVNHIAIVTRQGEVFTWGEEFKERLDDRIYKDFGRLHPIEFMEIPNLVFVACGEYHSCAISSSNEFFTWGEDIYNAGLLGHGTDTSHWIPKRIDGPLEGLQVVSIACGTWHSALATSDGKLFTFGDGAFGVLGHGDQESVMYPKEVHLLGGLKAIKVACGVWHTAAIIQVMFQSGSNVSPWKLFTWGDGDKYRLGHGNKETYLQPTRVASLIEYNFHQVACGHTMTVALTTSGHVFTMGDPEYGQLGNPMSVGKAPTLVQNKLLGEIVKEISCGAHHVATLTSKNEVYTWGRGANGRLGHGDIEDKKSPTLVIALKDRHIKNISCGSKFTSCICTNKLVPGSDQSICPGCLQAFGLTRIKHNCNNCGLAFCHPCSSKKALNAALASTPQKLRRVCDNCYTKLKFLEASSSASKFSGKAAPSHCFIEGREVLDQGVSRSSRTILSPTTKPMNYLEIRNSKPSNKYDSTSIVRASQVPSLVQLKDIEFPSSLSAIQNVLKPIIPQSAPQTLSSNSRSTSPITRRPSPPHSASPNFSVSYVDTLRKTSERLNQEVSKLQHQIQSLKLRSDILEVENQKLQKNATEASALAAVESSHLIILKEFIESTKSQLKEMTEKLSQETLGSKILRTIHTRVEDILKEISEFEISFLSLKLESEQINGLDILASDTDLSKLQEQRLEENVAIARVDPSQVEGNVLQENNGSKLEFEQQNTPNIPTSHSVPSKLLANRLEENVDATQVDQLQVDGNFLLKSSDGSKLEVKQHNAPNVHATHIFLSKLHEQRVEENVDAIQVGPLKVVGKALQESNGSILEYEQQKAYDIPPVANVSPKLHEHKQDEIANTLGVDPSHVGGNVLQESKGKSISSNGALAPPQEVEYGSRSLDSSRSGRQRETQIIEQFEPGVFLTLVLRPDGIKVFKRVRFSKRKFTKSDAEEWWRQNKIRVLSQYYQSLQELTPGSSNISSPYANEHIEASPSQLQPNLPIDITLVKCNDLVKKG